MTTDEVLIGSFRKNLREEVRVRLVVFHEHLCLDLRVFAAEGSDDPVPTKKGIALSVDKLPQLRRLIEQAEAELNLYPAKGNERV